MSESDRSEGSGSPQSTLGRIDHSCDVFEDAWKHGWRPQIEDYLETAAEPERSKLLEELLKVELEYRRRSNETFTAEEYQQRFPEHRDVIDAVFVLTADSAIEVSVDPELGGGASAGDTGIHEQPTGPGRPQDGAEDNSTPTGNLANLPSIPGYEILEELGRGGMGVVYKARQLALQRLVALKMILARPLAGPENLARFRREAEAVAHLQHPNIVQIHEIGEQDGNPYFTLEFVEGGSLAKGLDGTPRPARLAAHFVEKLARAIHAAHERGIIHRDLKPANILLAGDGQPKIADFGLAKRLDAGPGLTERGVILGTPSYMAPEQAGYIAPEQVGARTEQIGPRCDVYALGAILYELITGRPPFKAETALDTVLQVLTEEPVPPSRLQPKLPRELETICLKALAKAPVRRYATARALAEDLRRFLNGQPIQTRPMDPAERLWRWCRRNRMVAGLLLAVTVSLLCGTVLAFYFAQQAMYEKKRANRIAAEMAEELRQVKDALDKRGHDNRRPVASPEILGRSKNMQSPMPGSEWSEKKLVDRTAALAPPFGKLDAPRPPDGAEQREKKILEQAEGDRERAKQMLKLAEDERKRVERVRYYFQIAQAQREWQDNEPVRASDILDSCRMDLRGWEHAYLRQLVDRNVLGRHDTSVESLAISPDGKCIASGSDDGTLKVWNAQTGQNTLTINAHGRFSGVGTSADGGIASVAFSPDGKRIASGSGDQTVKIWDGQTKQELLTLKGHTGLVYSVAFSPDGKWIVTGSEDKTLKIWDAQKGQEIRTLEGHTKTAYCVAFSPDSKRIVSGSKDQTLKVWDAQEGQLTRTLPGHTSDIWSVAFSPDGKRIVSGSDDMMVKVWDAESGHETATLKGHTGRVICVAYSPDGKQIVSGGDDMTLKRWDAESGHETATLKGHTGRVICVAYSPDGKQIVSGGGDGTIRVWDSVTREGNVALTGHADIVTSVVFSPDGKRIVSGSNDRTLKRWDAESGHETATLKGHTGRVICMAYSPDGKRIVSGSSDATLKIWDAESGHETATLKGHAGDVLSVAYSPDGKRIVSGSDDMTLKIWDPQTDRAAFTLNGHTGFVQSVAFSSDGKRIVSGSADGTLKVWDALRGKEAFTLSWHIGAPGLRQGNNRVVSVAFSPDGKRIVSGRDGSLQVWDAQTRQHADRLWTQSDSFWSMAFSPDGKRIVTGSADGTLKVWDAQTGQEALTLKGHVGGVRSVAFSTDGKRIVSGSEDRTLKVWDSHTDPVPRARRESPPGF